MHNALELSHDARKQVNQFVGGHARQSLNLAIPDLAPQMDGT